MENDEVNIINYMVGGIFWVGNERYINSLTTRKKTILSHLDTIFSYNVYLFGVWYPSSSSIA